MAIKGTKWTVGVYEADIDGKIYTDTIENIARRLGRREMYVRNKSVKIGTRYVELKLVDLEKKETIFGSHEEIAQMLGIQSYYIRNKVIQRNGKYKHYQISVTGRYVVDYEGHVEVPKTEIRKVKPKKVEKKLHAVPMSDYWKMMFEMHTKHLKDYKRVK